MEEAELMTRMLFSWIRKALSLVLLIARSSIVLGADRLIILLKKKTQETVAALRPSDLRIWSIFIHNERQNRNKMKKY